VEKKKNLAFPLAIVIYWRISRKYF